MAQHRIPAQPKHPTEIMGAVSPEASLTSHRTTASCVFERSGPDPERHVCSSEPVSGAVRRQRMSGGTMDPSELTANSPTPVPAVGTPVNQDRPPAATPERASVEPSVAPPRGGRPQPTRQPSRIAIIVGGLLLLALIFALGLYAGHTSTQRMTFRRQQSVL